jgi:hypothetical protein
MIDNGKKKKYERKKHQIGSDKTSLDLRTSFSSHRASFTNGMAPVILCMPLFPTIRSIRSTVPGLNATRCWALTRITSSDAG